MKADFSGYATKAGLKCSDGRTIMPDAFKHQDTLKVPLVWQHGHSDPENVLGHAILQHREDGMYTQAFFNNTPKAQHMKEAVQHKDITQMSIWANQLIERAGNVLHGAIREVSLVLSGANPGALIDFVTITHSDGDSTTLDDEAIITTGLNFELEHAEGDDEEEDDDEDGDGETIQDVYDSLSDKQKQVVHFMINEVLEGNADDSKDDKSKDDLKQDNTNSNNSNSEGTQKMNVFEKGNDKKTAPVLSHADVAGIMADATKNGGSLKEAVEGYALAHGIENIELLFPDAKAVDGAPPEWITRRMEWVGHFLGGARKSPFSRIKSSSADLTFEDARAKGYVKGAQKKEQFFAIARRITTPTTVYKKQKLDRDDMVDITDFDVVVWIKGEMRLMLDEEVARAGLIGDGREIDDEDKVADGSVDGVGIRPIATDDEFYTVQVNVNIDDSNSSIQEVIDSIVMARSSYKGSGQPTMYTTEYYIARFLLLKDTTGRRIYKSLDEIATELRISSIVPVEVLEEEADIVAIIVNPTDYVYGADKGGNVAMFDDFDIDVNQYKWLIETRVSGCLTRYKSAMCVRKVAGSAVLVSPNMPAFDAEEGEVTITNQTGVVYKNGAGTVINAAGSPYSVAPGADYTVKATPASGYYFATGEDDTWVFTADEA